jgi:thiamine-phosphate pyrophosphorylase
MMSKEGNNINSPGRDFLVAVLTLPAVFDGEVDLLEGLLEAGLQKLHIRKPGATAVEIENLLGRLSSRWASRLVLHGSRELALRYGILQVHGAVERRDGKMSGGGPLVEVGRGVAVSTSVHSWEEFRALPEGLAYAFISPLFDSISKKGYMANKDLLGYDRSGLPCLPVGLGGIGADTIGEMLAQGWSGASVLGAIWEEPGRAVERYKEFKKIIDEY